MRLLQVCQTFPTESAFLLYYWLCWQIWDYKKLRKSIDMQALLEEIKTLPRIWVCVIKPGTEYSPPNLFTSRISGRIYCFDYNVLGYSPDEACTLLTYWQ